jgi:maleate isomerase
METEIPALLRAHAGDDRPSFTFHSSRMRMKQVRKEELAAMDAQSDRCAAELSDAEVDVLGYACLVATMSMGHGYHRVSEARLHKVTEDNGAPAPVVTSAGALVDGIKTLGARSVAVVTPYTVPLTRVVLDYIEHESIGITDWRALEVPDNLAVGRLDPVRLPVIVSEMALARADAIVLSACVQMPSLSVVEEVQKRTGKPVISAAIATTYVMLKALNLSTVVRGGGALLSGAY